MAKDDSAPDWAPDWMPHSDSIAYSTSLIQLGMFALAVGFVGWLFVSGRYGEGIALGAGLTVAVALSKH